jgi:hypothetical protein
MAARASWVPLGLLRFVLKKEGKLRLEIFWEILSFDRDRNQFLFHKRAGTCLLDAVGAVAVRGEGRTQRNGDQRSRERLHPQKFSQRRPDSR